MKAILISDHAIWCALMMNGIKKIEIRKGTALYKATQKLIDEYGYADFYVYCTKKEDIARIVRLGGDEFICERYPLTEAQFKSMNSGYSAKGKVVFKFRCYKVDKWDIWQEDLEEKLKFACLSLKEFDDYSKGQVAYAIHISDLEIFDKPKELSEFHKVGYGEAHDYYMNVDGACGYPCFEDYMKEYKLTKAPQNFCYLEEEPQ